MEEKSIAHDGKLYSLQCITGGKGPRVFISAGVHGNEPAGVLALQKFLEDGIQKYLDKFSFTIIPCVNPVGRAMNARKKDGVDLNRQFNASNPPEEVRFVKQCVTGRYVFSLDLHEDPTDEPADNAPEDVPPEEVYLYEISKKSKGRLILDVLQNNGFSICKRKTVYHESCDNGLLWRDQPSTELPGTLEDFLAKHAANAFTLETPTCWSLQKRIAVHLLVIDTALRLFQMDRE